MVSKAIEKKPIATLEMLVDFDEIPAADELDRILDEARAYGAVRTAKLRTFAPVERELA